jgi:CRISPR-associated protein Csm4
LPLQQFHEPVTAWLQHCQPSHAIAGATVLAHPQPHNSINRCTNTTGEGHAPYSLNQFWYGQRQTAKDERPSPEAEVAWDIYGVLDETRLDATTLQQALQDLGAWGFGRDASIGLGKFEVSDFAPFELPVQAHANAWLTLAPCAPQGLAWDEPRCFYQPFTRFGRHGDRSVHLGKPFKTPVLLANTAAVLTPKSFTPAGFVGQGLGGDGRLSKIIAATVQQGYAPVVGIRLPEGDTKP